VSVSLVDKLRKLLIALETAQDLANWRFIFRYDETTNTASDIDLSDYH
jgi:hypothetical protein